MGTFKAPCKIGPKEKIMEFHIMDITPNYSILLGKEMATSYWGYSLFPTLEDEDPMEGRDCRSAW